MAKGGGKGAAAKSAKAAHEEETQSKKAAASEAAEAAKWADGARSNKAQEEKAEKAAKATAAKAERARLLEEEESKIKQKPVLSKSDKKSTSASKATASSSIPTFSASGIDDTLEAIQHINEKMDKASIGAKAAISVDAHPERRYKAAFEAFKAAEQSRIQAENPGLRRTQREEILRQEFQNHPNNPFNQITVAYDATKGDKVAALLKEREAVESRLRTN